MFLGQRSHVRKRLANSLQLVCLELGGAKRFSLRRGEVFVPLR